MLVPDRARNAAWTSHSFTRTRVLPKSGATQRAGNRQRGACASRVQCCQCRTSPIIYNSPEGSGPSMGHEQAPLLCSRYLHCLLLHLPGDVVHPSKLNGPIDLKHQQGHEHQSGSHNTRRCNEVEQHVANGACMGRCTRNTTAGPARWRTQRSGPPATPPHTPGWNPLLANTMPVISTHADVTRNALSCT